MPKWRNVTAKDLDKGVATKLSLEPAQSKRGPERGFWYTLDGKKQRRITLPNIHGGSGSVSTGFIKAVMRDLMLDKNQFEELVDCALSAEDYEEIIREKLGI